MAILDFLKEKRFVGLHPSLSLKPVDIFYENPLAPLLPEKIVVLAHPHPLYEGNWHNKLISAMARAAHTVGIASLRMHFSTVGQTPGPYIGLLEESRLLHRLIKNICMSPGLHIYSAGFSFGGGALLSIDEPGLPRFLIAPSWQELAQLEHQFLGQQEQITLVHAYDDPVVPFSSSAELYQILAAQALSEAYFLGCGGHFFQGSEERIVALFHLFLAEKLGLML